MIDMYNQKSIKPCPKCGAPSHIVKIVSGYGTAYSVACNDQDCMFFEHTREYNTEDEAVNEWNRRVGERIILVVNIIINEDKINNVNEYNRNSILKLADECDMAFRANPNSAYDVIAKRIREACGMEGQDAY